MKHLIIWLFLFMTPGVKCAGPALSEVRNAFDEATSDECKARELLRRLSSIPGEPVHIGYKAATEALLAKFSTWPWEKYGYVRRSQETFSEALRISPFNLEIRFLRFAVQTQLPTFLNMSRELTEDKNFLLKNIGLTTDPVLKQKISRFLAECGKCSPQEIQQLEIAR